MEPIAITNAILVHIIEDALQIAEGCSDSMLHFHTRTRKSNEKTIGYYEQEDNSLFIILNNDQQFKITITVPKD